jgi:hypothetical protein
LRRSGLKQYAVFISPLGPRDAVKQGWSWPAFFFGVFWAFKKGLWQIGVAFLAVLLIESIYNLWELAGLINWTFPFLFGALGNRWRENKLRRRGFDFKAVVHHSTAEGALASYLSNQNIVFATHTE